MPELLRPQKPIRWRTPPAGDPDDEWLFEAAELDLTGGRQFAYLSSGRRRRARSDLIEKQMFILGITIRLSSGFCALKVLPSTSTASLNTILCRCQSMSLG